MAKKENQVVIPREEAVFWMGENGDWYNAHGKFEHPRIIKHFNSCIKKDENGYHVFQPRDGHEEKVYFFYKDTAIFVVDLFKKEQIVLRLNTNEEIELDPEKLFVKNDTLFLQTSEHLIKFTDHALLKASKFIEEKKGTLVFKIDNKTYLIKEYT